MSKVKEFLGNFTWTSFAAGALAATLVLGSLGYAYHTRQQNQLQEQVIEANVEARNWELAWQEYRNAYEERAFQLLDSERLLERVKEENEELGEALEDAGATVLSLQETTTRLEARLDSTQSTVEQTDSTEFTVNLDESVFFDGGGFVKVLGTVTIVTEGPSVESALNVQGEFPLTVVLSRKENGEIGVDAFTGDSRLTVTQLDVEKLVERPADGSFLDGISHQFTGFSPWLNRAIGWGICKAL